MRFKTDNAFKCGKAAYESGRRFSKEWLAKKYSASVVYPFC